MIAVEVKSFSGDFSGDSFSVDYGKDYDLNARGKRSVVLFF